MTSAKNLEVTVRSRRPKHTEHSANVCMIDVKVPGEAAGAWMFPMAYFGCGHYDNAKCQQRELHGFLDTVDELGGYVGSVGDLACAMQGKRDPRQSRVQLRGELAVDDYADRLVSYIGDGLAPWAHRIAFLGDGNHETAANKVFHTDLSGRIVQHMRMVNERAVTVKGGYGGWVLLRFLFPNGKSHVERHKYFHGSGGGAVITKGMIEASRDVMRVDNADVLISAHNHSDFMSPYTREYLDRAGNVRQRTLDYIKLPSWKDEFGDGSGGWAVEKSLGPRPRGGYIIEYSMNGRKGVTRKIQQVRTSP